MKFKWNSFSHKRKVHICDDNDRTLCKAENGSNNLDTMSDHPHPERKLCGVCSHLLAERGHTKTPKPRPKSKKRGNPKYVDLFLRTREWKAVRYEALKASDGVCECCGRGKEQGVILNVDHIKPRVKHPELALTLSNLQVLCADCNMGKGARDDTDWRNKQKNFNQENSDNAIAWLERAG